VTDTDRNEWRLYRGVREPHRGIDQLPPPPPWRTFDGPVLPQFVPDPSPAETRAAAGYLIDESVAEMVNVALLLRRPLLVTGLPGTGKSTLARAIARELQLGPVLYWPISSRSELADALYRYDAIGRLQQANLAKVEGQGQVASSAGDFIRLGPLGTALVGREQPRVLLVDELDKSDIDLPNDLLNVIEEGEFPIPELTRQTDEAEVRVQTADQGGWAYVRHGLVRCAAYPIIVITSNGEREFPPAFLRRCLRVDIAPPTAEKLSRIVAAQLGDAAVVEAADVRADFAARSATMALSTDQLLNAVYFATSGLQMDPATRRRLVGRIFRDLGAEMVT
jgi:MoxR-like ATPase